MYLHLLMAFLANFLQSPVLCEYDMNAIHPSSTPHILKRVIKGRAGFGWKTDYTLNQLPVNRRVYRNEQPFTPTSTSTPPLRGNRSYAARTQADTELQCDENNGWQPYCSHCYLMAGDRSWSEAEKYCVNHKAHLASVHSEAELDFLTNLLLQSGRCSAWLGVSIEWWDMFFYWDYDFRNTDNTTADYFRWNKREPNNAFRKEECVELTRDGHLNDYICKVEQHFICKKAKDFRPPPPSCPQCNCPTWVAPTPCQSLAPPSLPPACLRPSGLRSVILWNEKSARNHMHVDIKGSCMLVASPHWFGFIVDLSGYLRAGHSIAIRGRVKPSAERLIFKLIVVKGTALHLDFHIKDQKIVMASNLNGTKEKEETTLDSFPIEPGLDFKIIIQCDVDCFSVTVNGVQQLDFINRLRNVQSIRMLKMWRDMLLTDIMLM